jgi:hypothetical protein
MKSAAEHPHAYLNEHRAQLIDGLTGWLPPAWRPDGGSDAA